MSQAKKKVIVVGAGFSGLASAHYLMRAGYAVEVFEANGRAGGLISTSRESFGLVETAANGLLNSAQIEDLFSELGLELTPTLADARKRYVFRGGRARRWPLGVLACLRVAWFFFRFLFARAGLAPKPGETVSVWARRWLGAETARYTVETFLQGIYAGDPARMSASLIFGRFFSRSGKAPSRKPRIFGTVSAPLGMGQLIETWRAHLESQGVRFQFGRVVDPIGEAPSCPMVIATSAHNAATLLKPVDRARSGTLAEIEMLPLITATICFKEASRVAGFGCLFPPVENRQALGVLMNRYIFPNRAVHGYPETWILGGATALGQSMLQKSDAEIVTIAARERALTIGGSEAVEAYKVTRWEKALPHYTVELENRLPELTPMKDNMVLVGNYLGQIGLAKILERAAELPRIIQENGQWRGE